MRKDFETTSFMQYRINNLRERIEDFESGEIYRKMQAEYDKLLRLHNRTVKQLEYDLSKAHRETVTVRKYWGEIMDDLGREHQAEMKKLWTEIARLEKYNCTVARQRDKYADKLHERTLQYYKVAAELEEEKEKNRRLTAQLNRDFENSSIPSSMQIKRKKIPNNREKTGRKPGGQPGHRGHGRKKQTPGSPPVILLPPQEILDDPDFKQTGKTIVKQVVDIHMALDVREYHAPVYYNSKTGERVHGSFPPGVVNEVTYGGGIKAFLFLLNNECCVSIDKSTRFLSDLTGGRLRISKGMVSSLSAEFAGRTGEQRKEAFKNLLLSPVMHVDGTAGRAEGKNTNILSCASADGRYVLYFARESKGHKGVDGTPVKDYQGILVHDHESTFRKYGSAHQECLAHVLRYLKGSMENEPELTWNSSMHSLVQEMIHYRNGLPPGTECSPDKIREFEARYKGILEKAGEEYLDDPPGDYYKDGYNLYLRMEKYMKEHLLFLHDQRVPTTNNLSERNLRNYKRKQKQAVSFRSFESLDYLCQCMSVLVMMRQNEELNMFEKVSEIFG